MAELFQKRRRRVRLKQHSIISEEREYAIITRSTQCSAEESPSSGN